jgi:hypothetical protein
MTTPPADKASSPIKMTAPQVVAAIRKAYPTNAWAVLEQVGNSVGFKCGRWADVLAISLWPSRGLEVLGFEVKVSRSDWKAELAQPEKADAIQRYCDRWWIAAPAGVVPKEELPPNWGLMEVTGNKLKIRKQAPRLTPCEWDKGFIAAVLRRKSDADARMIADAISAASILTDESVVIKMDEAKCAADMAERDLNDYRESVAEFEKASGVTISRWRGGRIGRAVQYVLTLRETMTASASFDALEACARRVLEDVERGREAAKIVAQTDEGTAADEDYYE